MTSVVRIGHTALTWDVFAHPENLADAIRDCATLGFAGTETGGRLYDWWEANRPGELKRILTDHGVLMVCLFESGNWTDKAAAPGLLDDARRWSDALRNLGGSILMVVPGSRREAPPYSLDEFQQMAETMNRAGEIARQAGVVAAMHPHWGTVAEQRLEIELLLSQLDPELVGFAPDTGQIAKGGADPMPIVERWASRVRHVHLKDLSPEWEEMRKAGVPLRSPDGYAEMGQGVIDFRPLIEILRNTNYQGWLMAELDEAKRPPKEAATLSKRYIEDTLGFRANPA